MSGNILVPLKNWKKFLWAPSVKHASEFADILKQSNYLNFQETNVANNMFYVLFERRNTFYTISITKSIALAIFYIVK